MESTDILRPSTSSFSKFSSFTRIQPRASRISISSSKSTRNSHNPTLLPNNLLTPIQNPKSRIKLRSDNNLSTEPDFPQWLLNRNDFKSYILSYNDKVDIGKICSKPFKMREVWENRDLAAYIKSCVFFKDLNDFTCNELCEKLSTVNFNSGDIIIKQGEVGYNMYIIVSGVVGVFMNDRLVDRMVETNIVGEKALESDNPRNASVIAETDVQVLLLKKEDYLNIVMRHKHKQRYHIVKFLKSVEFFKDLLGAKLELIAFNTITARYKDKQEIFLENQPANSIYLVKEGSVKLTVHVTVTSRRRIPNKKQETRVEKKVYEKTLKVCQANDFFGEEELIELENRKCKAICCGDCEIFIVKRENLIEILNEKELKNLLKVHPSIPDSREAVKIVRKCILSKSLKVKAILNACNVENRVGVKSEFKGKRSKADVLLDGVYNCKDSLLLVDKQSFFE